MSWLLRLCFAPNGWAPESNEKPNLFAETSLFEAKSIDSGGSDELRGLDDSEDDTVDDDGQVTDEHSGDTSEDDEELQETESAGGRVDVSVSASVHKALVAAAAAPKGETVNPDLIGAPQVEVGNASEEPSNTLSQDTNSSNEEQKADHPSTVGVPTKVGLNDLVERAWSLCVDHHTFLDSMAHKYSLESASSAMVKLITFANAESPANKRLMFTKVQCFRCNQSSIGGKKQEKAYSLFNYQMMWLNNVHTRCNHPSIDKTVRIMLDFYLGLLNSGQGGDVERSIFSVTIPGVPAANQESNQGKESQKIEEGQEEQSKDTDKTEEEKQEKQGSENKKNGKEKEEDQPQLSNQDVKERVEENAEEKKEKEEETNEQLVANGTVAAGTAEAKSLPPTSKTGEIAGDSEEYQAELDESQAGELESAVATKSYDQEEKQPATETSVSDFRAAANFLSAVAVEKGNISAEPFIEAVHTLVNGAILNNLGKAVAMVQGDMNGNITKLKAAVGAYHDFTDVERAVTLEALLMTDNAKQALADSSSAAMALLWLTRALSVFAAFFEGFCQEVDVASEAKPLASCVQDAYMATLSQHHNFIVRNMFYAGLALSPTTDTYLHSFDNPQDKSALASDLKALGISIQSLVSAVTECYESAGLGEYFLK